jgi:hypothetical protein
VLKKPKLSVSLFFLFLSVIFAGFFISLPATTHAEIATGYDWIGMYPVDVDNDDPVWSLTKRYTNCTNSVGSKIPLIAGSCNTFMTPSNPGFYEFRLNANNSTLTFGKSAPFWVKPSIQTNAVCNTYNANVSLNWFQFKGINGTGETSYSSDPINSLNGSNTLQIYRYTQGSPPTLIASIPPNSISYTDTTAAQTTTYYYYIQTQSNLYDTRGNFGGSYPPAFTLPPDLSTTPVTTLNCYKAWFQTTTGDVHSNKTINTPGGPP